MQPESSNEYRLNVCRTRIAPSFNGHSVKHRHSRTASEDVLGAQLLVRPLLISLVLIDCDSRKVALDKLLALKQLVKTSSPNSHQLWLSLPPSLRSHVALTVCEELTAALELDPNSAKTGLLGSAKHGMDQPVDLLHSETQDMDERMHFSSSPARFLALHSWRDTSAPKAFPHVAPASHPCIRD